MLNSKDIPAAKSIKPVSKDLTIIICMGTGGLAAGSREVMDAFHAALRARGLKAALVKKCVTKTGSRGFCAKDVLVDVIVDGAKSTYQFVDPDKVTQIVEQHIVSGRPVEEWLVGPEYYAFHNRETKVLLKQCGEIDPEDIHAYIAIGGYSGLEKALAQTPFEVREELKASGLRGRGGAGFPTGLKWEFCSMSRTAVKYLIGNADEGDPGAFMDRAVIEGNPHSVLEGMITAAKAIGSHQGCIYCRAEYPLAVSMLNTAIDQARESGLLGKNILGSGFDFDLEVYRGGGAFVCGEETALMTSIEGKRGTPRPRPPFPPAVKGLWGKPSVLNNVETLSNIPQIIL